MPSLRSFPYIPSIILAAARACMSDGSGSTAWTYDPRGRVTGEQRMFIGAAYSTGWTYNPADLPDTMTYPDGEEVTYEYNSRMLLDTLNGSAAYVTGTEYDAAGRVTSRLLGNGLTQGFE